MKNNIADYAIQAVKQSQVAFCKFISANDVGMTGAHQAGFYIPKNCWPLMFDKPGERGCNKDCFVKIKWQKNFETDSRFIYYGTGTRNEYRLTRFGKDFPFLEDENVGDLIVICRMELNEYEGYILSADDDIENFFIAFNISSGQTNQLIERKVIYNPEEKLKNLFREFVDNQTSFPSTVQMSQYARDCYIKAFNISENKMIREPDELLLQWTNAEYELFKAFEIKHYNDIIHHSFESVDSLVDFSNTVLNRRKSRAGKSLEHHLSKIFVSAGLLFESQVITEENKKPDFIFPGGKEYHNSLFPGEKLVCLGAKTTCKDRWRQILNEADRIPVKHLFTLQQGISKNQLTEMYNNHVCLVVPAPYLKSFDKSFQEKIMTLNSFTAFVREKQC